MVGRKELVCDVDEKWDGPPPRCEPLVCADPPEILNGYYEILEENGNAYRVAYGCNEGFVLNGPAVLTCVEGAYDHVPPACIEYRPPVTSPPIPTAPHPPPTQKVVVNTYPTTTRPTSTIPPPNEEEIYDEPSNQYEYPIHEEDPPILHIPQPDPPIRVTTTIQQEPKPVEPNLEVNNNRIDGDSRLNTEESINVNIIHKKKPQNADVPKNPVEVQTKMSGVNRIGNN